MCEYLYTVPVQPLTIPATATRSTQTSVRCPRTHYRTSDVQHLKDAYLKQTVNSTFPLHLIKLPCAITKYNLKRLQILGINHYEVRAHFASVPPPFSHIDPITGYLSSTVLPAQPEIEYFRAGQVQHVNDHRLQCYDLAEQARFKSAKIIFESTDASRPNHMINIIFSPCTAVRIQLLTI